jgi:hypothetical protein
LCGTWKGERMIPKFRAWHKKKKRMYGVAWINFMDKEVSVLLKNGQTKWFDFNDIILM